MSATICSIFDRLQRDMRREFGEQSNVTDLREARIRREREASERRFQQRHGFSPSEPTPPEAA
ncbi:MAG TPA: hypothetical protein VGE64_00045 [Xanthomonadaceae bacterium]